MGVKGLLVYITNKNVLQKVDLSQLAKKIRHETGKTPKLLCDFMNLVPSFIIPPVTRLISCGDYPWYAQVTGPDFHLIADRACNFVAALKHLGVEPVFFVDGARGTDESFEGKVRVLKDCDEEKLQKCFRLQQVCEHTVDKRISMFLPCNAIEQIEKSVKEAGAGIVYCTGEAGPEIIHYAQSHDEVCGILSNDSNFAITNGCVMFPIEKFGLLQFTQRNGKPGKIKCQVIYPSSLADSLGIRENQLLDLAVLCGTDYTNHLNQQLSVLSKLGVKGDDVKSIAEWLKDKEMPLLQYQPMRELCIDHPELRVAVEQSYHNYTLEVSLNIDSPPAATNFASPLYHIIEKEARSGENNMLLPVAKKGVLWRTMIMENLTLGQPCLSSLLLPLRKVMYALLGVWEVREYGRSQMEAYDEVVVPVCAKPEDIELGIQCFHSLRKLEESGRLVGMFILVNKSLEVHSISKVKKVVNGVVHGSQKLPNLSRCRLVQSAMLCCCLKFIACLNKVAQPPLHLTGNELDAILVTCLTCATDGQIMPHIVNVMPSMRTFTVSEWFALILMHCYRVASLVGVVSCPEPKKMFYQMAFVPYHLAMDLHTTEQQVEIKYVQNAMKSVLTLPMVERFRTSIFNPNELQSLSLLLTLFDDALEAVITNAEKLLPCVMVMDDRYSINAESFSESEETESESELEIALDEVKAKQKSLSNMSLSARQRALKGCIWGKKELSIMEHRQMILNMISKHQVVCIEGETGCGKSSKVPQFILEASFDNCKIIVSQPNILTARKLAEHVTKERGEPLGKTVGYCDELENQQQQTILTFGTTGYMLKTLLKSPSDCSYTHIILDEIHERSIEIDYALFITRTLAVKFPRLKIILMSATLQWSLFTEYFRKSLGHGKVADPYFVGIKQFSVKVVFIDQLDELVSTREDKEQHAAMSQLHILARKLEVNAAKLLPYAPEVTTFTEDVCMNLIISQPSPGDAVLIFHSGLGDINEFCNSLHKKLLKLGVRDRYRLFIFHPQVQSEHKDEAFLKSMKRTIIIANRGVESSLTIPNLRLVINFGINKEMMYNSTKRISELSRQWCSRASCIQREGRVGRVCKGTAVHLFTKEFYETLPDFGPPEIIRVPLAKTFLKAKEIGRQLSIPLPSHLLSMVIEPPSFVQFSTALHDLAEYGAIAHNPQHKISEKANVTLLGKFSLSLPLDLNLCRLVLLGIFFGCPLDGIVIAAATAMYQDVFSRPVKVIMNDLHQFCHSLNTSTFSRIRYDDGYFSNPIMILNMFIVWLKYKSTYPHTTRRDLAISFQKAVNPGRLLHLEDFVGDIARCVANCIPHDTALYLELQTLSQISTENKGDPVFGDIPSQPLKKSCEANTGLLHFCNNIVILKALIAAAAPDEILCGERACESSNPFSRKFAQECIKVIENEGFSLSHTLCMDLSKLNKKQMQKTDEAAFEKLFGNFPTDFQLSVDTKVVKDIALLHFHPTPLMAPSKTAQSFAPKQRKFFTAETSEIPPEVNFFWRFGEQNTSWEVDEVDAVFPVPSHPCALTWYRFDESKTQVDTVSLNFRNPTGFVCKYDKPSQPYFAVATGSFLSGGNILAPRLTVLPNMPTSLMIVLAFQLSTSNIEFLINKKNKTVKAIKINSVEIPCTDIENYNISKGEICVINRLRKAISNAMALPLLDNGCIPLHSQAITRIPRLLQDLLSSCKPKPTASNSQELSINNRLQGLVWEMVTPGKSLKNQSTPKFSYYAEFRCSLVGREDTLDDLSTTDFELVKMHKKVKRVEADLTEDKQRAKERRKSERKQRKRAKEKRKSERKQRKRAKVEATSLFSFPLSPLFFTPCSSFISSCPLSPLFLTLRREQVNKLEDANSRKKDVEREMKMGKREMKERNRAEEETALLSPFSSALFFPPSPSPSFLEAALEEVVPSIEEENIREKIARKEEKKEKRKAEKKALLMEREKVKLPFWPVCNQEWMVVSENCSELRQKQDLDPQIATTMKQKLPTKSDNTGLENSKGGQIKSMLSVSQIVPSNGSGKMTVSKSLTTTMLHKGRRKTSLTTAESNPSVCSERTKTACGSVTQRKTDTSENGSMIKTTNRCQKQFQVSNSQKPLKETAISDDLFTKQKVTSEVATKKLSAQPSTGKCMAQFHDGFISECGGQNSLRKEVSLKETEKVQEERETTWRVVSKKETAVMLNKREESEAIFSERQIGREKVQKQREAALSKVRVEQAVLKKKEKKRASAISEKEVGNEKGALKGKKKGRKAAMSKRKRVKRKKKQDKDEVQKEKDIALWEKETVERQIQATLKGNRKVKSEKTDLMQDNMNRMQNKKSSDKEDKKEVGLGTTNSEHEPRAQSGIARPETSEENQVRSILSVSQFLTANGQAAIKPLESEGKKSLTTSTDNPNVSDESKITCTEAQIKKENGSSKLRTTTDNKCQFEVEVLRVSHTKEALKETAVSDISSTKHKVASKKPPNKITAQHSTGEHMPELLVSFISECWGQTRPATLMNGTPLKEIDEMQEEKETAFTERERVEIEKKEATLKGNGKVKAEEEDLMEEDLKTEKQKGRKVKERENKEVALTATNSEQEPHAHSCTAEPEGRLVVSVSQIVPTSSNSKQTVSDPLTVPKGKTLCKHQEKRSLTAATSNPSISDESKKTGPQTKMKTEISERGSIEAVTESANRCQSEVAVLKASHRMNPLKEMAVSDISSKQQATSKVAPNKLSAQHSMCEHMAQFPVDAISECGEQTKLATLREGTLLGEKGGMYKKGGAALKEKERLEVRKEASLMVNEKERVERRKEEINKVQKERKEVALCEKMRLEKTTALKDNKNVKREQEARVKGEDQQKEKRKEKSSKEKINERENKEATLAATTSQQKPSTQTGTTGPETSEGRSVVSVSQIVPTNGNGEQAVCKPIAASMGTQRNESQEKRSLITGMDNISVCNERKNTIPKTQMSENSITESMTVTANRCQSKMDGLKVSDIKEQLKETAVSKITSTKHKAASEIATQHSTGEHMTEFLVGFINDCGGQTRPIILMQEEKETALTEERVEIEKKEATLKGNGKVKTEEEDLIEEERKREKQKRRNKKKVKEKENKEVALVATNSEQEPRAHSSIAEPEGRLVVSVSQIVPVNNNSKHSVSDPPTVPKGAQHQEKSSGAATKSNSTISVETKKAGPETQMKTKLSEKGGTEAVTESANKCQSEVEVLKMSHTMNPLKEMAVSDISSIKQKAASKVAPNRLSAQHSTCEHMAQFPVDSISECGEQTKLATLREGAPLKEKGRVRKGGGAALNEERVDARKEASLKVKEREREEERGKVQKEGEEVILCKKMNVAREKATTLKDNKTVKREQEAGVREEDQQRENRKRKTNKKEKNELENKEATLAATMPEQNPLAQTGTAGHETSDGGSVVSVSQGFPTNGNHKQTVCKPIAASMGTQRSESQEKRSLIMGMGNASVPDERRTCPMTQMSKSSITESMTVRCQSKVDGLKVSDTKEPLKETVVSDISSTKHKVASKKAPNKIAAQHSTGEHMAEFLVGFISECGGQTRPATLMKEATLKDKDKMQEEKEIALTEERVEIETKETTLKGNGKVRTEKDLIEEEGKREKQRRRKKKEVKERERKKVVLADANSEQDHPAHSGIAEREGGLVVSVSQIVPTSSNSKQTVSDPLTAPKDKHLCKYQEKSSRAAATGIPSISDESKKTGPETQMKTKLSEKGSTEAVTESASSCQSEFEVSKVSHTTNPLKEMAVSDISSTKQKATSKVAPNKFFAQHSTCEHMAQFPVDSISECGEQTKLATLREGAPLKEKGRVHKDGGAALNAKERVDARKETSLKVKGKERVERRKEEKVKVQKEGEEVILSKKINVEREKATTLKDNKKMKREQEAGVREKDHQREKRKAKTNKKEKNELENKEATLAATMSEHESTTQTGTAGPETSDGGSVVSVSQGLPTNGNRKQTVCKPIAASMGTQHNESKEKRSLITGMGNTSVPNKRKNTIPKAQISANGMTVSANRCQSEVDVLKVTHTKKPLTETVVSDSFSTKQKAASKVAPNRIPAQPGTGEHMAQFLVDFINECGGQTRLATLRRVALPQYQEKYHWHYTHLSRGFLRKYDCFEISEDSSEGCHVRVVGAQRQSLANTELEKMEHSSKDTCVLEAASFPGSLEHIVEYLHIYLSSHFFPYGCPVSSLNELYQKEYRPRCSRPVVPMISANFLKEFSSYFVLQSKRKFVKLKEGMDHSDTSPLKGCPYTPQHVNDYFRRYLAQEGVVCTQQLQVLFSECYMKEFKMPQKPIIQFIQEDFFKQSSHLFVTFADIVVYRK